MCIVGLVGGIASGKSEVARYLEELGAVRLSADEINHQLLASDVAIQEKILDRFGKHAFHDDGQVDRKWLAKHVFGDDAASQQALRALEGILHPAIRRETERRLSDIAREDSGRIVVLDAPLLLEAGWLPRCREVLFVDTPLELRRQLAARRGWSDTELARRESQQIELSSKREAATIIVENYGSIQDLHQKLDEIYHELTEKYLRRTR